MRQSTLFCLTLCLCGTLLLPACKNQSEEAATEPSPSASTQTKAKITNVEITKVRSASFSEKSLVTGTVEPFKEVILSPEISGKLQWLGIREGQTVQKGALVARLDASILAAQKNQAEANYRLSLAQEKWQKRTSVQQVAQAETSLGSNMTSFNRQKKLLSEKVVSQQNFDNASDNLKNARIQLELQKLQLQSNKEVNRLQSQAQASNVQVAKANLAKAYVYAPLSGYVNQVPAEVGEIVSPGASLAQIVQMSQVKVVAGLNEQDIGRVKLGTLVNVRFDAYPKEVYTGPIVFMSATASQGSKTFPIKVQLQNPGLKLKSGMIGRLEITKQEFDNAVVIPLDAVIERGTERFVFVEENGVAVMRPIELGASYLSQVQVLSGLKAGENLITFGHRELSNNDKVKVSRVSPQGQVSTKPVAKKEAQ